MRVFLFFLENLMATGRALALSEYDVQSRDIRRVYVTNLRICPHC